MTACNFNTPQHLLAIPTYYTGTGSPPVYLGMSGTPVYDFTIPNGAGTVYAVVSGYAGLSYEVFIRDGGQPCYGCFDIDWLNPNGFSLGATTFTGSQGSGSYGSLAGAVISLPYTSGVNYDFSMQALIGQLTGCPFAFSAAIHAHRP